MESAGQKLIRNLKNGTFFKNVPVAVRNRLVKRVKMSNLIYFLDEERKLTKNYQTDIKPLTSNYIQAANYYLDTRVPLNEKSIVYSLGILTDVAFDTFVQEKFGCDIFMYDPTPKAIEFMEGHKSNTNFKFNPVGVWIENTTLKFYEPKLGGSSSVIENDNSGKYFEAKCLTMESIMENNNHKEISVFKADIEGAALPVLIQMVNNNIYPDQIVVEFERPKNDMAKVKAFFEELSDLRTKLKDAEYEEFLLPRQEAKYYSLEMLFVKKSKIVQ